VGRAPRKRACGGFAGVAIFRRGVTSEVAGSRSARIGGVEQQVASNRKPTNNSLSAGIKEAPCSVRLARLFVSPFARRWAWRPAKRTLDARSSAARSTALRNDANLTGTQTCGSSSDSPTLANASTNTTNNSSNNNNGWQGNNPARQGPKCDHDKKNKNPACNPPDLGGGTLESPTVPLTCNNQGICTAIAEVGVPDGATCGSGGTLLDFTADDFIGIVVFDGGEGNGQTLLFQHCTLTQQCGPGQGSYTCTDITDDVDQDSCGFYSD
jgi:hypothetical protein